VVLPSRCRNWEKLSAYFRYPANICKVIYTTDTVESVHRQFKTKGFFRTKTALSGADECTGEMDNADPELEFDIVAISHLF